MKRTHVTATTAIVIRLGCTQVDSIALISLGGASLGEMDITYMPYQLAESFLPCMLNVVNLITDLYRRHKFVVTKKHHNISDRIKTDTNCQPINS